MVNRKIVTVDGLAGSGKTTLARLLAKKLGFVHFSTGLIYRALAWLALKSGTPTDSPERVTSLLLKHKITLALDLERSSRVLVDGEDVTELLPNPRISEATSKIAALGQVRAALTRLQQEAYPGEPMVAEGRDLGSVIFPEADVKFFITASEEVRTKRREAQLLSQGASAQAKSTGGAGDLAKEVRERDHRDSTRQVAPTVPAQGAVIVDNSARSLTEVVTSMYDAVLSKIGPA